MRVIEASRLAQDIEDLCLEVSSVLPRDVVEALARCKGLEESPAGRSVIDLILENAHVAADLGVPLCQDTGIFTVYLTLAPGTAVEGDLAREAGRAVARATERGSLRPSVVSDPVGRRANTRDNSPPLVEVEWASGGRSALGVLAKGGGSEMASRLAMMPPAAGWAGALEFIVGVVEQYGARACPPLVLGVGIGGSFDRAPKLAKKALMIPLDVETGDPGVRAREEELLERVNDLGIGPGSVGGRVTCIGARIIEVPCHMANLPVAVSVNCHALRRKTIPI
jgi:tartrate/fumarate subfamily iron-sulfur-dependent hydro-lyase alpha chain